MTGYICRLNQSEMMEILDNEDLSSVLLVLAAVLNLKSSVEETIKAAQNKTKPTFEKAGMPRQSFDVTEIPYCFYKLEKKVSDYYLAHVDIFH